METTQVVALALRILDQWLTYLEQSHLHIYKEGDFGMNLDLREDLFSAYYWWFSNGFDMF